LKRAEIAMPDEPAALDFDEAAGIPARGGGI
jgi:hypothetical protein